MSRELIIDCPMNLLKVVELASDRSELVVLISNEPVGRSSMMVVLNRDQQRQLLQFLSEGIGQ